MTAVPVEIGPRPATLNLTLAPPAPTEPDGVLIVDDVEALAAGSTPGCNDDNPYR
ncbi:hypothetical protein [Streptosporangium nondiastaticum]|uniref:hypothetical protein n=1 Tax=Streptosporangium nondiastaticum TaxID=35764 RepID=UPI001677A753|nr:hypothetical protein [Streptosporangium nondiastaticum]